MLRKKFIGKTRDVFTTLSTSMEELSCEKSEREQVVNYFHKISQSLIFDTVLNTFLKTREHA